MSEAEQSAKLANGYKKRSDGRFEKRVHYTDQWGERHTKSFYAAKLSDAEKRAKKWVSDYNAGLHVSDAETTLEAWLRQWIEVTLAASDDAPSFKETQAGHIRRHVLTSELSRMKLGKIRPTNIERFLVWLDSPADIVLDGKPTTRGPLGSSSRRAVYLVLRKALEAAVRDRIIPENPAAKVTAPQQRSERYPALSATQLRALVERLRSNRYYVAYVLTSVTGMRRGEVLGLSWADVDLDNHRLLVRRSLRAAKGRLEIGSVKTKKSHRVVYFPPDVAELLRQWRERTLREECRAGARWGGADAVFVTQTGNYVSPREFLRYLQNAAAELDLPPRTCLHSLRHTAATIWLESGRMHVRAVADALGHSSTSVTTDIYTHTSPAVAAAGADILGAVLTPEETGETR